MTAEDHEAEFACPSCGLRVVAHAGDADGDDYLVHAMPPCDRFELIESMDDAADYMQEARIKLGGDTTREKEQNGQLDVSGRNARSDPS